MALKNNIITLLVTILFIGGIVQAVPPKMSPLGQDIGVAAKAAFGKPNLFMTSEKAPFEPWEKFMAQKFKPFIEKNSKNLVGKQDPLIIKAYASIIRANDMLLNNLKIARGTVQGTHLAIDKLKEQVQKTSDMNKKEAIRKTINQKADSLADSLAKNIDNIDEVVKILQQQLPNKELKKLQSEFDTLQSKKDAIKALEEIALQLNNIAEKAIKDFGNIQV